MSLKSKNNDFWTRLQKRSADDIYAEVKKRYVGNASGIVDLLASELYGDVNTVDSNKKVYDIALAAFMEMALETPQAVTQAFLTAEVDTLQSVTSREASTTFSITTGGITANGDATINGDFTVNGNTTYINTTKLQVSDNIFTLNYDVTETPSENAGMEIERGTSANVGVIWNETTDRWTFTNDGSTYYNIPISTEYDNYGNWNLTADSGGTATISSSTTVDIAGGNHITTARSGNTITINHNAASWGGMAALSGATVISDVNIDAYGHVSSVATRNLTLADLGYSGSTTADNYQNWKLSVNSEVTPYAVTSTDFIDFIEDGSITITRSGNEVTISGTNTAYSAGSGISIASTVISHSDTSTQANVANSGLTVVQDLTFDTFGHVTAVGSQDLTESIQDMLGTFIVGGLDVNVVYSDGGNTLTINHDDTSTLTGAYGGSLTSAIYGVTVDGQGHVTAVSTVNLDSFFDNYSHWSLSANGGAATNVSSTTLVDFIGGSNVTVSRAGTAVTISSDADVQISEHELQASDFTGGVAAIIHNLNSNYLGLTAWVWNTVTSTKKTVGLRFDTVNANELNVTTSYTLGTNERYRIVITSKI